MDFSSLLSLFSDLSRKQFLACLPAIRAKLKKMDDSQLRKEISLVLSNIESSSSYFVNNGQQNENVPKDLFDTVFLDDDELLDRLMMIESTLRDPLTARLQKRISARRQELTKERVE